MAESKINNTSTDPDDQHQHDKPETPSGPRADNDADPKPFTKEYFVKRAAEAQEKFRRAHPDRNVSEVAPDSLLSPGLWQPVSDLSTIMTNGSIPKEVNDKLQAATRDFALADYSRAAFEKFAIEARSLLVAHDEALRLVEDTLLKTPEVWDKMHEYAVSKQGKKDESLLCLTGEPCS